jgi:VCBS repeat-containing protein
LNGDGNLDIVVGNNDASTVSIRLGNGTGTFTSSADVVVGNNPASVVLGDLNGDGRLDLVVANQFSHTVSVRIGNGDGTFVASADIDLRHGALPTSVVVGHLTTDGRLDLAVTNNGFGSVAIRLNTCGQNLVPLPLVPSMQTVPEDTTLTFSPANGNAITVTDDGRSSTIHMALTAVQGALSLGATAGLRFETGDGTDDSTATFSGTLAQVNAALTGLSFRSIPQYNGPASLIVTVRDDGHTGGSSRSTSTETVPISVAAINDAPLAVGDTYSVVAQTTLNVPVPGVLANDTDIDSAPGSFAASAVTNPTRGTLTFNADGGFTYTPNTGFAGTDSFTYRVTDGTAHSNVASVTITVSPIQCVPRPKIVPSPVVGGGKLAVHVESTPLNTQRNNPLQQITFGDLQNAKVTMNGQAITRGQVYTPPAGTVSVDFTVERITPGQPTMVYFTVKDGCGDWKTFVGGGTAAGF